MDPAVSIIIPFAGPVNLLKECLNRIKQNTDMNQIFEMIIVADKCDDETLDYLRPLYKEGVRLILNPKLVGIARALNYGSKIAMGEYICYVATDVEVAPGWLEALKRTLDEFPKYGWAGFTHEGGRGFDTGVTMIRRDVLDEIGYWDEIYSDGVGFMDDDLLRKLWHAGYKPHIIPDVVVKHEGRESLRELYSEEEEQQKFLKNQKIFSDRWGETGTVWENLPVAKPVNRVVKQTSVRARFIGGVGACGGGILRRWLNLHPDVYAIGETGFISSDPIYDLTPPSSISEVSDFIYTIASNRQIFPAGSREREILDQCISELFNSASLGSKKGTANFIDKVFTGLAELNNKTIWVEKNPMNIFFGDRLREYFGDEFRIIWVEREPRDNICCIAFSRPWGPNDLLGAIDHWAHDVKMALESLSAIPELCMRVSYEEFVYNQVAVGKEICQFLQIPWHQNLETPVTTDADIGRHKREFTLVRPAQPPERQEFTWNDRFAWTRNMIEELTGGNPRAQIVDIGCNECPVTKELPNCTWVDIKSYDRIAELMRATRALIYRRDPAGSFLTAGWQNEGVEPIPRARYIQASAESLPFEDKQFDVAVATQLLAYPENPVAVLKEIRRVAKRAIITVRNEQDWDSKYRTNPDPNMRFYTEEMLKQHLGEAGIHNYEFRRLDYNGWSFFAVVMGDEDEIRVL